MFPDVRTQTQTKKVFSFLRNKSVERNSFRSVGSLFHARGAATVKALSPIRRHVRGMTSLPHDKERTADRANMLPVLSVTHIFLERGC